MSAMYILPTHSLMAPMTYGLVLEKIFVAGSSCVDYLQTCYNLIESPVYWHIWISMANASSSRSDFSGS